MKILLWGDHPLAPLFGWVLSQQQITVTWYTENTSPEIEVEVLDARKNKTGILVQNSWKPQFDKDPTARSTYDWVFLFSTHDQLSHDLEALLPRLGNASFLVSAPRWENPASLNLPVQTLWALPSAGAAWDGQGKIKAALMPTFHLGQGEGVPGEKREALERCFSLCGLTIRLHPHVETWLKINFAVNAGLASQALAIGESLPHPTAEEAFSHLVGSFQNLRKALLAIREALAVVKAQGLSLGEYKNEVGPYGYPAWFAAFVLQGILKKNEPAVSVMALSGGLEEGALLVNQIIQAAQEKNLPLKYLRGV